MRSRLIGALGAVRECLSCTYPNIIFTVALYPSNAYTESQSRAHEYGDILNNGATNARIIIFGQEFGC